MRRLPSLAPTMLALLLCGCGSLLGGKPQPFTIHALRYLPAEATTPGPAVDWQLAVETPHASDALTSARMLASPAPGTLEVFPGARWSDPAPSLVRELTVEAFTRSGRIVGVGSSSSGLRADFTLTLHLQRFDADFSAAEAQASVALQARLLGQAGKRVVAARAFAAEAPLSGRDATSAARGMETALGQLLPELVAWTLAEGERARTGPTQR